MPAIDVKIPTVDGELVLSVETGRSIVFIGANGGGKTRLGAYLEDQIRSANWPAHRVAAQRAIMLKARIDLVDFDTARFKLEVGADPRTNKNMRANAETYRLHNRWGQDPAVHPLNDFEALLQTLFAENARQSVEYKNAAREGAPAKIPQSRLDKLLEVWHELLPHRRLIATEASLLVSPTDGAFQYDADQLSDGERVIFYLIGQALTVRENAALIIDEPELHIHKAIMAKLCDALEARRPDCAFIYMTHDLEFAASRAGARKFALRNYFNGPKWEIEVQPEDENFSEETIARIVGSRRPILFVEGNSGSLDAALYRRIFDGWTVIPVGSCEVVVHSVASLKAHFALHRLDCAGIIDPDGRDEPELATLKGRDVHALPVAEVENLFLLRPVFVPLAMTYGHTSTDANSLADKLQANICTAAAAGRESYAIRHTKRRVDRTMKSVGLEAKTLGSLQSEFASAVGGVDISAIYSGALANLDKAVAAKDADMVLQLFDNKAMLGEAAKLLATTKRGLEEHIGRMLHAPHGEPFRAVLVALLPTL